MERIARTYEAGKVEEPKFCINCKHHDFDLNGKHLCYLEKDTMNMIDGSVKRNPISCEFMRKDEIETQCGTVGRFFEPNEVVNAK